MSDLNSRIAAGLCVRLVEITSRRGKPITARDIATANLAIAALRQLDEHAHRNLSSYSEALGTSVERGIQLDAVREMLEQIVEILE